LQPARSHNLETWELKLLHSRG